MCAIVASYLVLALSLMGPLEALGAVLLEAKGPIFPFASFLAGLPLQSLPSARLDQS